MNCSKVLPLKTVICIACIAFFVQMNVYAGDPVPGAEIYIEQEPNDEPCAQTATGTNGKFIFQNSRKSLKKGQRYSVKIRMSPSKLNQIKQKSKSRQKFVLHIQIGHYKNNIKQILIDKRVIIDSETLIKANGRKIKILTFVSREDLEIFVPLKAQGSRGGFAVGGFSQS